MRGLRLSGLMGQGGEIPERNISLIEKGRYATEH